MLEASFMATAVLYAAASLAYYVLLSRGLGASERYVHGLLGAAVLCHVAFVALERQARGASPFVDIHGTLTVLSLGTSIAFLLATLRYRIAVVGAFVTPITLAFLLGAGVSHHTAPLTPGFAIALLPVHVGVTVLGLVAFALAFGASLGYVLQERKLRRKELTGIFRRLPPLDVLDTVSSRALVIGFPLFTAGVILGALFVARGASPDGISPAQMVGLVTWLVFASVLFLRVLAGWQGRRAAIGTMLGFACSVVVLTMYALGGGAS